jgi:hypothetical protein
MSRTGKPSSPEQTVVTIRPPDDADHTAEHTSQTQSFPRKLHQLIEHAEYIGSIRIISWHPDGRSFKIHQKENFTRLLMPEFFHYSITYASFERNLTLWGFQKVSRGPIEGSWYHPSFMRNKPEVCRLMNRANTKVTGSIKWREKSTSEKASTTHQSKNREMETTVLLNELRRCCEH